MEEEYREIEFRDAQLRVYRNGTIWRLGKGGGKGIKKGEWGLVNLKTDNEGYIRCRINGKLYSLHRIISMVYLGLDIDDLTEEIDHINRIRNDNRVENLRIGNKTQNQWNRGEKGCSFDKASGKWRARISENKVRHHLGYYETEEEAEKAYQDAKLIRNIII
jgi:HNH endonuclease/AP2 domain